MAIYKYGRRPGHIPVALKELGYYAAGPFPAAPPAVAVPAVPPNSDGTPWGMDGNDKYGDCGVAGLNHYLMAAASTVKDLSTEPWPSDEEVVDYYLAYTGGQDTGVVLADFLAYVKTRQFYGHTIQAYAPVGVHDIPTLTFAIWAYAGTYTGIYVTSAMEAAFQNNQPWTLENLASPQVGGHCLAPGTRVLTDTLTWVPIENLSPGDSLTAFDENPPGNGCKRQYRKGTVLDTQVLTLPCYELEFDDGTVVTAAYDHLWMVARESSGRQWVRTDQLRAGTERASRMYKLFDVWEEDKTWEGGYLAAAFDGEGWLDGNSAHIRRLGFAQRSNEMLETTGKILKASGFSYRQYLHDGKSQYGNDPVFNIAVNGRRDTVRFLGSMRPQRLLGKFHPDRLGAVNASPWVRLVRKTPVGPHEVIALQTDTRTYIAEGLPSHNCVPLVGYDSNYLYCVTWGKIQPITYSAWHFISDEAWAIIPGEFANGDARGFNLTALQADLAKLA